MTNVATESVRKSIIVLTVLAVTLPGCGGASRETTEPTQSLKDPALIEGEPVDETEAEAIDTEEQLDAWLQTQHAGQMDADLLEESMQVVLPDLQTCYDTALVNDPTVHGKVVVKFAVDDQGQIAHAVIVSSEIDSGEFMDCLLDKIMDEEFPAAAGGVVSATYPLYFEPYKEMDMGLPD